MSRSLALAAALVACTGTGQPDDVTIRPDTDIVPVYVGIAQITPADLSIDDAPVQQRTSGAVELRNVGVFDLTLASATLPEDAAGALQTDTETNAGRVLKEDEAYEIIVVCEPPDVTELTGTLRIETDDADNPVVDVSVTCRPTPEDTDG